MKTRVTEKIAIILSNWGSAQACKGFGPSGLDGTLVAQHLLDVSPGANLSPCLLVACLPYGYEWEACPPGHQTEKQMHSAPEGCCTNLKQSASLQLRVT